MIYYHSHVLRIREENGAFYTLSPYAKVICLNASGAVILKLAKQYSNSDDLVAAAAAYYHVDEAAISDHVMAFLEMMMKCGILEEIKPIPE